MTDENEGHSRAEAARGTGSSTLARWLGFGTVLVFAAVAGYGIARIGSEGGGSVILSTTGVEFTMQPREDLESLIAKIVPSQNARALLERHDIYDIHEVGWVNRLRNPGPGKPPLAEPAREALLQLLYDLAGPFALPDTLARANAQFYGAIETLDRFEDVPVQDPDIAASPFLTTVVVRHLARSGIFRQRDFNAEVFLLHGAPASEDGHNIAYVCAGSELQGLEIMLFLDEPERLSGLVPFEVRGDPRVRCVNASQTFSRFLARHPARIGISVEAFERLYGTVKPGATLPSRVSARFEVKPKDFVPVVVLPSEVRHEL